MGGHVAVHLGSTPTVRIGSATGMTAAHVTEKGTNLVYILVAIPFVVAVIVAVVVWRSARRERSRKDFQLLLGDPDPLARRRALDAVTDDVLARNSKALLAFVSTEPDPDVLDAVAAAVARSRWEPTQDRDLVELRRWVAGGHAKATASSLDRMLHDEAVSPTFAAAVPAPTAAPATEGTGAPDEGAVLATSGAPQDDAAHLVGAGSAAPVEATGTPGAPEEVEHEPAVPVAVLAPDVGPAESVPEEAVEAVAEVRTDEEVAAAASPGPYEDLVPTVRALLGEDVDRVELRLLNGTVLQAWSKSGDAAGPDAGAERGAA